MIKNIKTRQKTELETKFHRTRLEVEELKKRDSVQTNHLNQLSDEYRELKLQKLKLATRGDKELKKKVEEIEMEFRDELSGRDGEIRMLSGELKKVENERNRVLKKLEEMETRLRIRDEEISLLEEKILGLQKTIR